MNLITLATSAPAPSQGGGLELLMMIGLMFVVFYFLLIRPQNKRQKAHKQMLEAITKGAEVVTNGGLLGRVQEIGENFVQLELSEGVSVKVQKHAIASQMPKGTFKTL